MDDLLLLTTSHGENVSILFADADGGGLHIETDLVHIASPEEEERLRQWLYRRHRKLVGARKARSPVVPDHLLPLSSIKKDDIP